MAAVVLEAVTGKMLLDHGGHVVHKEVKHAAKQLKRATNHATRRSIEVVAKTGAELRLTIDHLRNTYEKSLDTTLDKVDKVFLKNLLALNEQVEKFAATVDQGLDKLEEIALVVHLSAIALPFANRQPRLTSYFPKSVILTGQKSLITFVFQGVFPLASQKGFTPTLSFLKSKFFPVHNLDNELRFQIPSDIFKCDLADFPCILETPWETGNATFNLLVELFPPNPGEATLELTTPPKERQERGASHTFDRPKVQTHLLEVTPSPGWKIALDTLTGPHLSKGGQHFKASIWTHKSCEKAVCQVQLTEKHILKGVIHFKEFQPEIPSVHTTHTIPLTWNFSQTIPLSEAIKHHIKFHSLVDGEVYESNSELDTPFVHIQRVSTALTIQTTAPKKAAGLEKPRSKL